MGEINAKIEKGGLKLIVIESKEVALKCKWVQYMKGRDSTWFYEPYPIKDDRIWNINLEEKDVLKFKMKNTMARDILRSWSRFNFKIPEEKEEILSQVIWGNSLIRKANKPIWEKRIIKSGIDYIYQLKSKDKEALKEFGEICEDYGEVIGTLDYNAIKVSIPLVWKSMIKYEEIEEICDTDFQKLSKEISIVKRVYWTMVEKKNPRDGCKIIWEKELNRTITEEEWEKLLGNTKMITKSTKLRYFQYKILRRIVTTNVNRAKWDKQVQEQCYFCNEEKEVISHLFWECKITKKFLHVVRRWIRYFIVKNFDWNYELLMFNNYTGDQKELINTFILETKRYIYVTKCLEEKLTIRKLLTNINTTCKIEKIIAMKHGNMKKFEKKWSKYVSI